MRGYGKISIKIKDEVIYEIGVFSQNSVEKKGMLDYMKVLIGNLLVIDKQLGFI